MKIEKEFRTPSVAEAELLQRLLTAEFPGKKEITKQLESVQVRTIDEEGSLELRPTAVARPAAVEKRIPVEAEGVDDDGSHVHVLLHVVHGLIAEMEIYKDDGSPIKRMPPPDEFTVVVLPA